MLETWLWVKIQIVPRPSEHPNPTTKIGSKMGGEFTYPKMAPLVLTHSHILRWDIWGLLEFPGPGRGSMSTAAGFQRPVHPATRPGFPTRQLKRPSTPNLGPGSSPVWWCKGKPKGNEEPCLRVPHLKPDPQSSYWWSCQVL